MSPAPRPRPLRPLRPLAVTALLALALPGPALAQAAGTTLAPAAPVPAPGSVSDRPPVTSQAGQAPAAAEDPVERLGGLLALPEIIALMQDEGAGYAEDVEGELFPGKGGGGWIDEVRALYAPERTSPIFFRAFRDSLGARDLEPMARFFTDGVGARAVPLEVSARRAMLDPDVEDDATLKAGDMMAARDPRFRSLSAFIEAGDMVEANVIGGLNANLAFWRGLSEGGAFPEPMAEEDLLAKAAGQEEALRAESRDWLFAYLALAYAPLSERELADYTAFSASGPGRALNTAIFAGFDAVFVDVSHRMGVAAAHRIAGQTL
ncbi:hypothetical protein V8J36_09945 [Frigidibacter sp. MR17.14]|uniref:hypothetical protein n=1 Tax=Frigidibacter sp. MR17.14 TaxID=3126509 RepID=UPI003012B341